MTLRSLSTAAVSGAVLVIAIEGAALHQSFSHAAGNARQVSLPAPTPLLALGTVAGIALMLRLPRRD